MAEEVVIVALIVCCLAVSVVSWLAKLFAQLVGIPFGVVNWFLHGLGFLVVLPFLLTLMVLTRGFTPETWWVGGFILVAAAISFVGGGIRLLFDHAGGRSDVSSMRGVR